MARYELNDRERGKEYAGGVPLVLVHGFPFDSRLWEKQLDGLGGEMWVVAPDMPGMGKSEPFGFDREATMDDYAAAIADWAESRGIEKMILAGHSMGGYIAFAFARNYPDMLSKLILVATKASADTEAGKEGRYKMAAGVREKGISVAADAMLPKMFAPSTYQDNNELVESVHAMVLDQQERGVLDSIYAMASRPDSKPDLPRIKVPTLIISGACDEIIPAAEADTMHAEIAGSRHIVVPDGGHLLMLEDARTVNGALRDFV